MRKARKRIYYIPMKSDTAGIPECYSWPDKKLLIKKVTEFYLSKPAPQNEEEQAFYGMVKRTIALMHKNPPNTGWLLKLVGMWIPEDEIFKKSYKYVRPKLVEDEEDEYLSNEDGFFDG